MSFVPLFEVVVSKKTEKEGFLNDNNNNNNTPLIIENDSILQSQTIIVNSNNEETRSFEDLDYLESVVILAKPTNLTIFGVFYFWFACTLLLSF